MSGECPPISGLAAPVPSAARQQCASVLAARPRARRFAALAAPARPSFVKARLAAARRCALPLALPCRLVAATEKFGGAGFALRLALRAGTGLVRREGAFLGLHLALGPEPAGVARIG